MGVSRLAVWLLGRVAGLLRRVAGLTLVGGSLTIGGLTVSGHGLLGVLRGLGSVVTLVLRLIHFSDLCVYVGGCEREKERGEGTKERATGDVMRTSKGREGRRKEGKKLGRK